ncbi:HNH endonuclease signature motif containing protein [Microbacterium sp.]|uniref:HNH endonuclease signature motif containing protein n=1 Tax=Microbacterium sp. TaxID=51671 RepID=UPI0039E2C7A4
MEFFTEMAREVDDLRALLGDRVSVDEFGRVVNGLDDDGVVAVLAQTTAICRLAETLRIVASGVAGARSTREHGHGGLTQKRGHRNVVSLVQEITGGSRADAAKTVRLGESLLEAAAPREPDDDRLLGEEVAAAVRAPWHTPLSEAQLVGTISATQHDVIRRGLGEPPTANPADIVCACGAGRATIDDPCERCTTAANRAAEEAWSTAAAELIAEAAHRTVEELGVAARTVRDLLDPEGAERRFTEQFERRSFRVWTDRDGVRRGSFVFDPHGGSWVIALIQAAMRPRRGGPRFVDPDEKARAQELTDDPRTNDQLVYDLIIDTLRAGSLADAASVFGTKQAGVRVIATADTIEKAGAGVATAAVVEDDLTTVPGWVALMQACDTGTTEFTVDRDGNPLYLGREARLFSARQKVTLAARDGGCRWPRCDRPASYCESHHIDHVSEGGATDVDRGILLCRFHHMVLHNGGWRITREGLGEFVLHPPPGTGRPIVMKPRLALAYAWADLDPPPRRFRPGSVGAAA